MGQERAVTVRIDKDGSDLRISVDPGWAAGLVMPAANHMVSEMGNVIPMLAYATFTFGEEIFRNEEEARQ